MTLFKDNFSSPLGNLVILANSAALLGIWFSGQKHFGGQYNLDAILVQDTPIIKQTKQWLTAYFAGKNPKVSQLKLAPDVTPFRHQVLDVLVQVPYGRTITYGGIAKKITEKTGNPHVAARAVGGAVGHNPISIVIPCHRVIGSDGSLTGFAAGLERKVALLKLEGIKI